MQSKATREFGKDYIYIQIIIYLFCWRAQDDLVSPYQMGVRINLIQGFCLFYCLIENSNPTNDLQ